MFISNCVVVTYFVVLLNVFITGSENDSNINLLKNEITDAMLDCGETKESRQAAKEAFEKKAKSSTFKTNVRRFEVSATKPDEEEDEIKFRGKRNIVAFFQKLHKQFGLKSLDDSSSGEWDYDDNSGKGNSGRSWNDPKDDKSILDSVYGHEKRNDSKSNGGSVNKYYGGDSNNTSNDQNSTKYNTRYDTGNNFDSRGARMAPRFRKLVDDVFPKSVRDLNLTTNYYDPFMTRGIRSAGVLSNRVKRFDKLVKGSNDNECLSQCVFTNLQIVDDRGIPKEALFTKLLQDTISSQQSRIVLENQLQSCFDEMSSESEENGCSYSNALDRCMGLQLKKRKSLANEAEDVIIKVETY